MYTVFVMVFTLRFITFFMEISSLQNLLPNETTWSQCYVFVALVAERVKNAKYACAILTSLEKRRCRRMFVRSDSESTRSARLLWQCDKPRTSVVVRLLRRQHIRCHWLLLSVVPLDILYASVCSLSGPKDRRQSFVQSWPAICKYTSVHNT